MILSKKKITNDDLWQHLLRDTAFYLSTKNFVIEEIYEIVKGCFNVRLYDTQYFDQLVTYLVEMGYDEDDYAE